MAEKINKNKNGFTLAEVLITLGIIGVIAALVIPGLIENTEKRKTVEKLKKVYSTISQASSLAQESNGDMNSWDWDGTTTATAREDFLDKTLLPFLRVQKKCNYGQWSLSPCRGVKTYYLGSSTELAFGGISVILSDGTPIIFFPEVSGYFRILFDLNGNKGPNMMGRDAFYLILTNKNKLSFYPSWWDTNTTPRSTFLGTATYGCNKDAASEAGMSCGGLILKDGWQIMDDYPWN